jgi:hypothetical protein
LFHGKVLTIEQFEKNQSDDKEYSEIYRDNTLILIRHTPQSMDQKNIVKGATLLFSVIILDMIF